MGNPPGGRALRGQVVGGVYALALTSFYLFPFLLAGAFDESGESRSNHPWAAAVVFAVTGALFMLIALVIARRRREAVPGAELL
jgi:hypothetical protein